jgi:hypothetical protein
LDRRTDLLFVFFRHVLFGINVDGMNDLHSPSATIQHFKFPNLKVFESTGSRRAACSRHAVCFFSAVMCRVLIPARRKRGPGFKTRWETASVGRRLGRRCLV